MAEGIGGIDASIPLQAGRGIEQPNPLKQIGEFAGIQNALNQAKLNPGALELQKQAIQAGASKSQQTVNQVAYQALTPFLRPGADLSIGALTTQLASIEHNLGIPTGGILPDIIQATTNGDPATAGERVRMLIASRAMISPESAVTVAAGSPTTRDTGLGIESGTQQSAVGGGGFAPASTTQVYPTRGQQMVPTPISPGAGGAPRVAPLGYTSTPELSGLPSMGTGRINVPASLRNPNAPSPAASTEPAGARQTGVGPEEERRLAATGEAAGRGFQAISDEGVKARAQDALLGNMMTDLTMFTSGSQADRTLGFKRFLSSWGAPVGQTFGVNEKTVAAQESFDKLANQLADAQGAGSDARLHVNQGANPSSGLSPGGADFILRQLRGNADYLRARQQFADQWGDKSDLQGFNATVTRNLDPRVFQYERLTPEQKSDYFKGIKDAKEREAFKRSHAWATTNGLIGGANAGQ